MCLVIVAAAIGGGGFGPVGIVWGVGVGAVTFGVGGPLLAGIPWGMAALPAALMVLVVFMAVRGRLL